MKIENNENIQKSLYSDKATKNKMAQGTGFKAVLENEVGKSSKVITQNQKMPSAKSWKPRHG